MCVCMEMALVQSSTKKEPLTPPPPTAHHYFSPYPPPSPTPTMSQFAISVILNPLPPLGCLPHPGLASGKVRKWSFSSICTTFYRLLQHIFKIMLIQHIAPISVKYSEAELQVFLRQISLCEVFLIMCALGRWPQKWAYLLILMAVASQTYGANVKTNTWQWSAVLGDYADLMCCFYVERFVIGWQLKFE